MEDLYLKIVKWLQKYIGFDGLLHIVGMAFLFVLLKLFGCPVLFCVLICMAVGIVKELYDLISRKGTAEFKDVICDIIGIIIGLL